MCGKKTYTIGDYDYYGPYSDKKNRGDALNFCRTYCDATLPYFDDAAHFNEFK